MSPKEYAIDLHAQFLKVEVPYEDSVLGTIEDFDMDWESAKKCAIICLNKNKNTLSGLLLLNFSHEILNKIEFLESATKEIEKL